MRDIIIYFIETCILSTENKQVLFSQNDLANIITLTWGDDGEFVSVVNKLNCRHFVTFLRIERQPNCHRDFMKVDDFFKESFEKLKIRPIKDITGCEYANIYKKLRGRER
jgi:hypothetical protein